MTIKTRSTWWGPGLLLFYGFSSVLFGALQIGNIQSGPPAEPNDTMHYFEMPIPIMIHIVSGMLFSLLGPLQFAPVIRQRWPRWHRMMGTLLLVSGLGVAGSAIWMNEVFPEFGGLLKYTGVLFGSVLLVFAEFQAIRFIVARNIASHRAWMMRALAMVFGPATQRFIVIPYFVLVGMPSELFIGFLVWSGWIINLAFVEWFLWRERRKGGSKRNLELATA